MRKSSGTTRKSFLQNRKNEIKTGLRAQIAKLEKKSLERPLTEDEQLTLKMLKKDLDELELGKSYRTGRNLRVR